MRIEIELPAWLDAALDEVGNLTTDSDRMALAVRLARRNVSEGTGGPFAALVLDEESGQVLAAGVNVVVSSSTAVAHGEVTAIALAGQRRGDYDLGRGGRAGLYTSAEPCLMCLGATVWSGVRRLVVGARDADVRAVGFDEGPKPAEWSTALAERGIEVVQDVLREDATQVLIDYAEAGGPIYNAEGRNR